MRRMSGGTFFYCFLQMWISKLSQGEQCSNGDTFSSCTDCYEQATVTFNTYSGWALNLDMGRKIQCYGMIESIRIKSYRSGTGWVDIWKPLPNNDFLLVHSIETPTAVSGQYVTFDVSDLNIHVTPGYVIGSHALNSGGNNIAVREGSGLTTPRYDILHGSPLFDLEGGLTRSAMGAAGKYLHNNRKAFGIYPNIVALLNYACADLAPGYCYELERMMLSGSSFMTFSLTQTGETPSWRTSTMPSPTIAVIGSQKSPHGFTMGSPDGMFLTEIPDPSYHQPTPPTTPRKNKQSCLNVSLILLGILLISLGFGFIVLFSMSPSSPRLCREVSGLNGTTRLVPFSADATPSSGVVYKQRYDSWINQKAADGNGKTPLSFDDMYNSSLVPKTPQVQWVGNNELTYLNSQLELILHNVDTDKEEVLMTSEIFIEYRPSRYQLSPDRKYVLITYEAVTEVQDASSFAKHKVYDLEKKTLLGFPNQDGMRDKILMQITWTPKNSGLTFVYDDDMYHQGDPYAVPERLTTSGATHKIRNGHSFWNYRGVLQASSSMWWSADMTYLIYGEFDSTDVVMSEHPVYANRVYPAMFRHVYLKAGDPEHFSRSKMYIIDMTSKERTRRVITPPAEFKDKDHYFYNVLWRNNKEFAAGWTDRRQKRSIVEFCDTSSLDCKRNHDMTVQNGWFRGPHMVMFIDSGASFVSVLAKEITGKGRIRQVATISSEDGKVTYITDSDNEVIGINAYDSKKHLIYFTGNNKNQLQQHIFRVGTEDASPELRTPVCLTCDEGESCATSGASFSSTTDYYILSCLGPNVPYYHLRWTTDLTKSFTIMDNAEVKANLATRNLPTREFHEVNVGDGYTGWAEFILPPGMVRDGSVKYPVMFYPYAGPHGHTQGNYNYKARSAPGGLWDYFLASSENIIVVRLNGRGSGMRGDDYLFQIYRKLGTYEVTDQIDGARSIREKFPFVDGDRMAVWGWSYGGYTSSHALGHPSDVFKCAIAVAPVINYRHYYAAYTEKYMDLDTADDNAGGYNLTDATRKVENFRNKKYMIAHGTLDDNVHFQMAMEMIKAMTNAQIQFKSQVYVDQNHGIRDFLQNRHLFISMTDFYLNDCLGK